MVAREWRDLADSVVEVMGKVNKLSSSDILFDPAKDDYRQGMKNISQILELLFELRELCVANEIGHSSESILSPNEIAAIRDASDAYGKIEVYVMHAGRLADDAGDVGPGAIVQSSAMALVCCTSELGIAMEHLSLSAYQAALTT